ncbi:hypothetical protein K470DRAFT_279848 [Piedraia hortae CBS 480.64]|uniref:Uncharacterized protein n=1 Tax=Piedraia hortae CBS 480.64 TaxID=1314780 RepID=A0A6A7C9T2_9PEZI|nr:hypothetical protein K470DRAFT_279848 [Piedraia hortae CBS 480.64]
MADSQLQDHLDPDEQPIYDRLSAIREELLHLKADRNKYVKSADVQDYFQRILAEVDSLNKIREPKRHEQNRVDYMLDDCFQLVSLFFLTIGRISEAPAIYSAISTVKRLLDHLKEADFYSPKDLESISNRIDQWQTSVDNGRERSGETLTTLLDARIDVCRKLLAGLKERLSRLDPGTADTYEKLVSILRSLSACNTRSKFPADEVEGFVEQLRQIRKELDVGTDTHVGMSAEQAYADRLAYRRGSVPNSTTDGPAVVRSLLRRCLLWAEIVQEKQGKIDERFKDTYQGLVKIRNNLEQMSLTQAWSLRETDLYSFQRQLDRIDESRVNGNFLDANGRPADLHAQRTLLYLLRKSYAYIYQYLITSEPVSEALLPIYNQLLTLKRCLEEVHRSGGVDDARDLYPYSMKLMSIDNMKKDGKFMVGNDIPEGQASVCNLLADCFDLTMDMRREAQEREEDEDKVQKDVEIAA